MKRSPMPRRRATPRRKPAVTCRFQRCSKRPAIEGMCQSHALRTADDLFSKMIRARDGRCVAREFFPDITCWGGLQAMHLVRRRYGPRFDPINAASGCVAHHHFLTVNPDEHFEFCERWLGTDAYAELRARRHDSWPPLGEVIERLKEAA